MKHETIEEVPTHKWVVETVCNACAGKCNSDAAPQADDGPALQPIAATQATSNETPGLTSQLRRMLPASFSRN